MINLLKAKMYRIIGFGSENITSKLNVKFIKIQLSAWITYSLWVSINQKTQSEHICIFNSSDSGYAKLESSYSPATQGCWEDWDIIVTTGEPFTICGWIPN